MQLVTDAHTWCWALSPMCGYFVVWDDRTLETTTSPTTPETLHISLVDNDLGERIHSKHKLAVREVMPKSGKRPISVKIGK